MTTQTLQGALQQAVRTAFSTANDFNGDLHAMCDWYGVPAAPISGRLIPAAKLFDPSITDAASALNYFLQNPTSVPALALDFTTGTLDPRITFTRGSQATLFNSAGTLVFAPNNVIRNNTMVGAVAGTPGTLPTNWSTSLAGLTQEIVGTGTQNGINYIDIRLSGTSTGTQAVIRWEAANSIAVLDGQAWTHSVWLSLRSGTLPSGNVVISSNLFTSGGAYITDFGSLNVKSLISANLNRVTFAGTINSATAAFARPYIYFLMASGEAVDFTLRIGMPQLERGSVATAVNATSGTAYYGPRFDYDPSTLAARGLLIEEARTNSIRNNTMQGAVAGTPGTLPTNWRATGTPGTLTLTVVGTGTENGITYIDIRYSGTTSSTGTGIAFEVLNNAVAANGQTWTNSVYLRVVAGSLTNISSITLQTRANSSVPATVQFINSSALSVTGTLQRFDLVGTISNASTAFIDSGVNLNFSSGVAIDITLRIGLPQLEQGAFATSVIPTTTTALTRSADVASMTGTNFSSWYNAVEGTIYTQAIGVSNVSGATRRFVEIGDGGVSERMVIGYSATTNTRLLVVDNNTTQADITVSTGVPAGSLVKMAAAYKVNDFQQASNNTLGTADASGTLPTVTTMFIGADINAATVAATLNGHIQRISYYPTRLPDGTLQALTA